MEATERNKFCQEDHRSKRTDARDAEQMNGVGTIRRLFGQGTDLFCGVSDHLSKILQLLDERLECLRAAGGLHGDLIQPYNKSFRPVLCAGLLWEWNAVETKQSFDLVLAPGLLLDQAVTCANE